MKALLYYINQSYSYTVQTFNSSTSRPDVCWSLVVQTPMDNMSVNKPNTLMTHKACESKLRSVVRSFMHPYSGNWVQSGVRSCIMPGLPANLVQELNVGTVKHGTSTSCPHGQIV